MPTVYVFAVVTLAILSCLSALAGFWVGDLDRLPMQWGLDGRPTWYAPKWIALGFIPVIGVIVMATVAVSHGPGGDGSGVARNMATVGAILVAAEIVYLFMLRRHLTG
ncbi:DUF1648 domain-containing protein [Methylobacterium sp. E-045]|jgi:hypothetical protein|uniref:DUF1648 domain-containing protein n=1 Tax=Methylobacterium sp. E-045 TaxID=2836575 RepID=UPI001FB89333|nr:DUF1648 domain-containing protein [Methylobacterium sp. E-045]MCJ2128866.1 DUF1648 domain-containing protein [Methylobacterium sp. E-045]